jgi:Autotransporter beta-domain
MGEYAHTWTSLEPSGDIDVDSGRGGVYANWFTHGFYLDGGIYGGHDVYSSSRATLEGMANGGTGGAEYSALFTKFRSPVRSWNCPVENPLFHPHIHP